MDFKLDQTVYFQDSIDSQICVGTITGIFRHKKDNDIMLTMKNVRCIDTCTTKYAEITIKAERCCATIDDLMTYIETKVNAERDIYRWGINSVNDLIQFVLKNDVSGQSYNAEIDEPDKIHDIENKRAVFVEKANELLGLKIEFDKLTDLI